MKISEEYSQVKLPEKGMLLMLDEESGQWTWEVLIHGFGNHSGVGAPSRSSALYRAEKAWVSLYREFVRASRPSRIALR